MKAAKPDILDDPGTVLAEAKDNRRAMVVVAIAGAVVAIACGALMATQHHSPDQAVPRPAHTLQQGSQPAKSAE
jgi:hypothetical protein